MSHDGIAEPGRAFNPRWRWDRASLLVRENRKRRKPLFLKRDDAAVRSLFQYIRDVGGGGGEPSEEAVRRDPDLRAAWLLWSETNPGSRRHTLEAVMLADDMPDAEAARLSGVSPGVAKWYIDAFWDLREKGAKERYIGDMHLGLRSYRHGLMEGEGYKFIVARGGLDRFKRIILERRPTNQDLRWFEDDETLVKALYTWSKTWESIGDSRIDPLELQRREIMNPRRVVMERAKASSSGGDDCGDVEAEVGFTVHAGGVVKWASEDNKEE